MTVYAITDTKKGRRTGIAPTYLQTTHDRKQLNSTQREFTDAGETPHCPHLFIN